LVKEAADTLQKTLNEEEEADKKLTSIAESQVRTFMRPRAVGNVLWALSKQFGYG
jgi:ferritin-like metal-binding protein YciE